MYVLELKTIDGKLVDRKELGSWRERARETFGRIKWKMSHINTTGTLELIDTYDGSAELTYTQIGEER